MSSLKTRTAIITNNDSKKHPEKLTGCFSCSLRCANIYLLEDSMNRHERREQAFICVYQNLILPREVNDLIHTAFGDEGLAEDPYMKSVIETAVRKQNEFTVYINQVLNDWTFDRLGCVEQALLLCGCAEFDLKQVEAPVIIDEYVDFAKQYGDDSHKLINGVLDRI